MFGCVCVWDDWESVFGCFADLLLALTTLQVHCQACLAIRNLASDGKISVLVLEIHCTMHTPPHTSTHSHTHSLSLSLSLSLPPR